MSLEWIEHEGQRILLIDVANLRDDHSMLAKELASLVILLKAEPKKSVLAVADLRNTNLNNNAVMALIRNAPLAAPHFRKSALVIEPNHARSIILDTLGQFVERLPKRFDNLEDAKAWLIRQELKQTA
jgi:hypothetical protein